MGLADVADLEQARRAASTRRSVEELDVDVGVVAGGGGPHDGADGLGGAAAPADHAAEVAGPDVDVEADPAAALGGVDLTASGSSTIDVTMWVEHGRPRWAPSLLVDGAGLGVVAVAHVEALTGLRR